MYVSDRNVTLVRGVGEEYHPSSAEEPYFGPSVVVAALLWGVCIAHDWFTNDELLHAIHLLLHVTAV